MERLEKLKLIKDEIVAQDKAGRNLSRKQNDIPGSFPNHPASVFHDDKGEWPVAVASIPGYNFILVSDYREIWILEGVECYIVGVGSPFSREDYVAYLNTLPKYVVSMVAERMEHYRFKESSNSVMFAINGTVRVLDAKLEGRFYIAYPGEEVDYEVMADINDASLSDTFKKGVEKFVGNKMMSWLRKKFELQK